mgnify:CR=1 FL=1
MRNNPLKIVSTNLPDIAQKREYDDIIYYYKYDRPKKSFETSLSIRYPERNFKEISAAELSLMI